MLNYKNTIGTLLHSALPSLKQRGRFLNVIATVFALQGGLAFGVDRPDYDIDQHIEFDSNYVLDDDDIGLSCINGLTLYPTANSFSLVKLAGDAIRTLYEDLSCSAISSSNPRKIQVTCKHNGSEVLSIEPRDRRRYNELGEAYFVPGSFIRLTQPSGSPGETHTYCSADRFETNGKPKRATQEIGIQCASHPSYASLCDVKVRFSIKTESTPHFQDRLVQERYLFASEGRAKVEAKVRETGQIVLDRSYDLQVSSNTRRVSRGEVYYYAESEGFKFSAGTYRIASNKIVQSPEGGQAPTVGFTSFGGREIYLYVRPNSQSDFFDNGMCGSSGQGPFGRDRFLSPKVLCQVTGRELASGH